MNNRRETLENFCRIHSLQSVLDCLKKNWERWPGFVSDLFLNQTVEAFTAASTGTLGLLASYSENGEWMEGLLSLVKTKRMKWGVLAASALAKSQTGFRKYLDDTW